MIDKFIFFFSPPWVLHSEEKSNLRHVLDKKKTVLKAKLFAHMKHILHILPAVRPVQHEWMQRIMEKL